MGVGGHVPDHSWACPTSDLEQTRHIADLPERMVTSQDYVATAILGPADVAGNDSKLRCAETAVTPVVRHRDPSFLDAIPVAA